MSDEMYTPNPAPQGPATNEKATPALVCGILGIVGSFIPVICYFALIPAILGIVLGAKGMKIAKITGQGQGLATAGLVLGIIGTALSAFYVCTACAAFALIGAGIM